VRVACDDHPGDALTLSEPLKAPAVVGDSWTVTVHAVFGASVLAPHPSVRMVKSGVADETVSGVLVRLLELRIVKVWLMPRLPTAADPKSADVGVKRSGETPVPDRVALALPAGELVTFTVALFEPRLAGVNVTNTRQVP
jgi:hypothetical protein